MLCQRTTGHILQSNPEVTAAVARLIDPADAGMMDARRDLRLAAEALFGNSGRKRKIAQHLKGDGPSQSFVLGPIDRRLRTTAEHIENAVGTNRTLAIARHELARFAIQKVDSDRFVCAQQRLNSPKHLGILGTRLLKIAITLLPRAELARVVKDVLNRLARVHRLGTAHAPSRANAPHDSRTIHASPPIASYRKARA